MSNNTSALSLKKKRKTKTSKLAWNVIVSSQFVFILISKTTRRFEGFVLI